MNIDKLLRSALELLHKGDVIQAEYLYNKILKAHPANPDALYNLSIICCQRSDFDSAIKHLKRLLQYDPDNANANNNMGLACQGKGQLDEAEAYFQKAIQENPALSNAYYNYANILKDKGNIDKAISNYQKALQLDPNLAYAYNNLGTIYIRKGNMDEAIRHFKKALSITPLLASTHYNLGLILLHKGQIDEAIICYRKALQLNPQYAEVYKDLGIALQVKGSREEAIACYRKAIELNLTSFGLYNDLGLALQENGQIDEATDCYLKAIELNPHRSDAFINMGNILKDMGQLREAQKHYGRALQIKPSNAIAFSNILFTMNYDPCYDAQTIFKEHLEFAKKLAEPLYPVPILHKNNRNPNRRLRIGYVSPDFKKHSVAYFMEPVLSAHNHDDFEIFCYSDVLLPDDVTKRIQAHADFWRNITGMSDENAAEMISGDMIDILIDLAGHTAKNRMLMFARKPAPIQISWIGYPATTGLSVMDYKIVDHYTDPEGMTEKFYTEQLLRMPESFLCYLPHEDSPEAGPLPALNNGYVTFGSFNNFSKISDEILIIWSQLLKKLPGSHLILKSQALTTKTACDRIINIFQNAGVSADRIEFLSFIPSLKEHLRLYNSIDIALDTYPYHGTTTTCEALWMGVPVITLAGNTHVSRVGVSILSNIGLPEFIAKNKDEFINTALHLANNGNELQILRKSLRQNMRDSALCDKKRFVYNLEALLRSTWNKWCETV